VYVLYNVFITGYYIYIIHKITLYTMHFTLCVCISGGYFAGRDLGGSVLLVVAGSCWFVGGGEVR